MPAPATPVSRVSAPPWPSAWMAARCSSVKSIAGVVRSTRSIAARIAVSDSRAVPVARVPPAGGGHALLDPELRGVTGQLLDLSSNIPTTSATCSPLKRSPAFLEQRYHPLDIVRAAADPRADQPARGMHPEASHG